MAATVIDDYSVQLNQTAPGAPQTYAPVKANEHYGRVRVSTFRYVFAAQASGHDVALCIIPKGARILGGILAASATLANSATLAVGLAGKDGTGNIKDAGITALTTAGASSSSAESDAIACLKAAAVQGATQVPFAITQALGYLYETQKEVYLTMTTGTGAVTTEVVTGEVRYVVD